MDREMIKLIFGTTAGVLIGGFVGFVVTQRVLKAKYEALLDAEIASLKAYYQGERKESLLEDPSELLIIDEADFEQDTDEESEYDPSYIENLPEEELQRMREELQRDLVSKGRNSKIIQKLGYSEEPDPSEVRPDVPLAKMTMEEAMPIDYEDEMLREMMDARTADIPYVITIDEFMEDDPEIEKVTVTYFDGDGNLADTQDKIIPEVEEIIGSDALTKFGLYSKDKNIVYVRNERIKIDFEVVLDERSYTEAIAGFRNQKLLKKMREDD